MDASKRRQNEKKFGSWEVLASDGRRCWYEVQGRYGWIARYIKVVDSDETTVRFYQEIYNDQGNLVEVHHKYPVDSGHTSVELEEQP